MESHSTAHDRFDVDETLDDIESTATKMARSTDVPVTFTVIFVGLIATLFTLLNVVSWTVILGIIALFIPIAIWYYLLARKRPKPRTLLNPSKVYVGYFAVMMIVAYVARFWEIGSVVEGTMKWLVLFGALWFCVARMQREMVRIRVKEANERAI